MTGALIVTAMLDEASQARFDGERARYFPAAINYLQAHVTLFHALPAGNCRAWRGLWRRCAGRRRRRGSRRAGCASLGAAWLTRWICREVVGVRATLAAAWRAWLTPQDRQGFRPHVTVQNKVAPDLARALLAELQAEYAPWRGVVPGLALWRYEGGPWRAIGAQAVRRGGRCKGRSVFFP